MMFRKPRFFVVPGQIGIEYVDIVAGGPGFRVAEIGTVQKYAQIAAYGGGKILIGASPRTHKDSYSPDAGLTVLDVPPPLAGWVILPELVGRYSMRVAFYRSPFFRPRRLCTLVVVPDPDAVMLQLPPSPMDPGFTSTGPGRRVISGLPHGRTFSNRMRQAGFSSCDRVLPSHNQCSQEAAVRFRQPAPVASEARGSGRQHPPASAAFRLRLPMG
jgi:hypothetical protein